MELIARADGWTGAELLGLTCFAFQFFDILSHPRYFWNMYEIRARRKVYSRELKSNTSGFINSGKRFFSGCGNDNRTALIVSSDGRKTDDRKYRDRTFSLAPLAPSPHDIDIIDTRAGVSAPRVRRSTLFRTTTYRNDRANSAFYILRCITSTINTCS